MAQALPQNRIGTGGAALQAIRQIGGTFGVALTIALLGTPSGLADALVAFDHIWWLIVAGGLIASLLVLPMRTPAISAARNPTAGTHDSSQLPDSRATTITTAQHNAQRGVGCPVEVPLSDVPLWAGEGIPPLSISSSQWAIVL